jgi:predicted DNA-binding transcriptional regulator YafY
VDRQLYLLRALAGRKNGRTAEDLHQELEDNLEVDVSIRSVYRDLDDLSVQFPITDVIRESKTYYSMMDHFKLGDIQCSFDELMALVLMNRMLESLGSDPTVDAGLAVTKRLISGLPELQQRYLGGIYRHFRVELPGSQARGSQIFETFVEAVRCHRAVKIRYHAFISNEISERTIHPYTIYFRQQYYIVAWCTARESIREFRLDRILDAESLETSFTESSDFNYEDYTKRSWGGLKGGRDYQVVLKFTPESSRFVQEYHGDKADSLKDMPDGSLEFYKSVSALDEIFPWVLSQGPDVEVLAPQELKDMVVEAITKQAQKIGLI